MSAGDWRSVRHWTVCTVVLAGHLGALLLISHHQSIQQRNLAGSPMEVVLIPQLEDSSARASVGTKLGPSRGRSTHVLPPAPRPPPEGVPTPTDDRPNVITDWGAAARPASDDVLREEREQAERRSFKHVYPTPALPEQPGIFGSEEANHRADRVEGGGTQFWVTDNCYFDIPRGVPPPPVSGNLRMPTPPTCKPPPTGGGEPTAVVAEGGEVDAPLEQRDGRAVADRVRVEVRVPQGRRRQLPAGRRPARWRTP